MPQQTINIGSAPDDGTGDTIRVGGDKINDNFTELYTDKADKAGGTFTGDISVPDEAYDATAWNGSLEVPTKNAIRDKIESLGSGITELDDIPDVNAPTPANGDVLTWDSTPGEWVPQAPAGAGSFVLDDATDVNAPTPSNGDVLTWDSTPGEWVAQAPSVGSTPAMTLISEVVTSASQANVTFSSISGSYRDLVIVVRGRSDAAGVNVATVYLQFNSDTGSNYMYEELRYAGTASAIGQSTAQTQLAIKEIPAATATANYAGWVESRVYDYRGTTFYKVTGTRAGGHLSTSSNNNEVTLHSGQWLSTSAITAVKVFLSAGNFVNNSVVSLYGVL